MVGGIYTDEKCPMCAGNLRDNRKDALNCPNHPQVRARLLSVRFKRTHERFSDYEEAAQFLSYLRIKSRDGTYDERDYKKQNPLGISALAAAWLDKKKGKVKAGTLKNLKGYVGRIEGHFGDRNIKEINYGDIEDFLDGQDGISNKTRHNLRSALHDLFSWVWKRNKRTFDISQFPEFPTVKYQLGRRKIISKEVQAAVIEEVKRICPNMKVCLGIKWLATYGQVRPGELLRLEERYTDRESGTLFFWDTKENDWKWITLLQEDVDVLKSFPLALPHLRFFRHEGGTQGTRIGQPFGEKYLYKWWKRACANLGIEDVDLYGGTRHSSATALNRKYSPEEIRRNWTRHKTNKAFDRYFDPDITRAEEMYLDSVPGKELVKVFRGVKKPKLLKFKE